MRLGAPHFEMLRHIRRAAPGAPYQGHFTDVEIVDNDRPGALERRRVFLDLEAEQLIWFEGYGGRFGCEAFWVLTRTGAELADRRAPWDR
jgi:hypothetical protein